VFTRVGERCAVALGCVFRRPSRPQSAALEPVWAAALARAGVRREDVDLYVQRSGDLNAYAVGGRSVAVTSGVLHEFLARRLGSAEMESVLLHDWATMRPGRPGSRCSRCGSRRRGGSPPGC
jgi:STE24 endopeptidase